jgi:Flp pilus assembly protein TadG
MKPPAIRRIRRSYATRRGERGVTMVLVALAMVAIIAMAALSIDVVTLYLAREEAQRAADAGALAAARVISISGATGTAGPDNGAAAWSTICGGTGSVASVMAQAVAQQNSVGSSAPTVTVTYSSGSGSGFSDCTAVPGDDLLGVNPLVTVQVTRNSMPTLFSRIWSRATNTVSASATAEAFNPSNSGNFAPGGLAVPVTPRCVKPWIIPNLDPKGPPGTTLVDVNTGAITREAIVLNGVGRGIGENFTLTNACTGPACTSLEGPGNAPPKGSYFPALVSTPARAVPSCSNGASDAYQGTITGCDESTVYACGTPKGSQADLTANLGTDTSAAVQCLTSNQDTLDVSSYPFRIGAGVGNTNFPSNQVITSSNSIVSLPIYDNTNPLPLGQSQPQITIVGFLQVFISSVDANGNMDVHVLNIAGCGNGASTTVSAPGTSPVPIRLITPQ